MLVTVHVSKRAFTSCHFLRNVSMLGALILHIVRVIKKKEYFFLSKYYIYVLHLKTQREKEGTHGELSQN